jgi:hypothetical protein
MNSSQTLYKISNLRYSIRIKEVECNRAAKAGDQHNIHLNKTTLALLKEELAVTIKAFNTVPAKIYPNRFKRLMGKLFQFKILSIKKDSQH